MNEQNVFAPCNSCRIPAVLVMERLVLSSGEVVVGRKDQVGLCRTCCDKQKG